MVEFYEIYEEANKTEKPRLLKSKFSVRKSKKIAYNIVESLYFEFLFTTYISKTIFFSEIIYLLFSRTFTVI